MVRIVQHPVRLPDAYPKHLEEEVVVGDGIHMFIRPVVPGDAAVLAAEFAAADDDTVHMRFFNPYFRLTADRLRYLTEIDYHSHVALAVMRPDDHDGAEGVAIGRYVARSAHDVEGAIVVKPAYRRLGIAQILLDRLVSIAAAEGYTTMSASYLVENDGAAALLDAVGFTVVGRSDECVDVSLDLGGAAEPGPVR